MLLGKAAAAEVTRMTALIKNESFAANPNINEPQQAPGVGQQDRAPEGTCVLLPSHAGKVSSEDNGAFVKGALCSGTRLTPVVLCCTKWFNELHEATPESAKGRGSPLGRESW